VTIDLPRRLFAEVLGTALLFTTVIGSGIMAEQLAGGNVAVALIGNTLAVAAMLYVLITMLGPVSGAHFNPAVTLVLRLLGEIGRRDAALYVVAQLAGGVAGVVLTHAMFGRPLIEEATQVRSGAGLWLGEAVASFVLLMTILGVRPHAPGQVPVAVAAVIAGAIWFTSSTCFANPAITLARALSDSFTGIRPMDAPAFIAAQFAGALLAMWCARWLYASPDGR
jgi:glycerol uptake facilitator-like aquaporin